MIVVIGKIVDGPRRMSPAAAVAVGAATAGAVVQLVGVVPDDPDGDRRLVELAAAGVGHAAVLRGSTRDLEPADVDLALGYLPEIRVVVTVGLSRGTVQAAGERAAWAGSALIVIDSEEAGDGGPATGLPPEAIVLGSPPADPDGTFAGFVAALAARIDAGATTSDAWAATTRALAVDSL